MLRALEVAKDVWDELGRDLAGAPAKIGEHVRVCQVIGDESMNVSIPKIRVTSRRSGQRGDVRANVATFGPTSRRSGQRRDVRANVATFGPTSRRSGQRRDVRANVAMFGLTSQRESREIYL